MQPVKTAVSATRATSMSMRFMLFLSLFGLEEADEALADHERLLLREVGVPGLVSEAGDGPPVDDRAPESHPVAVEEIPEDEVGEPLGNYVRGVEPVVDRRSREPPRIPWTADVGPSELRD